MCYEPGFRLTEDSVMSDGKSNYAPDFMLVQGNKGGKVRGADGRIEKSKFD